MADDFLALSPTYLRGTSPKHVQRRALVVALLRSNYKTGRNAVDRIITHVRAHGFPDMTRAMVNADVQQYRMAYTFLMSSDSRQRERLRECVEKGAPTTAGLRGFLADGIETWDAVQERLKAQAQPSVPPAPRPPPPETVEAPAQQSYVVFTRTEADRLEATLTALHGEIATARAEAEEHLRQLQQRDTRIGELEREITHRRAAPLGAIADAYPALAAAVGGAARAPAEPATTTLSGFPKTALLNGSGTTIAYERKFHDAVAKLPDGAREQLRKALGFIAAGQPNHTSLGTKKVEGTKGDRFPKGARQSRAGDYRFIWTINKTTRVLHVHECYHRGASPFSEA